MEHNRNKLRPEAATDEPASSFESQQDGGTAPPDSAPPETATRPGDGGPAKPPDPPDFAEPPLLSDCLEEALAGTLAETFPPDGRKPRHDGWTPQVVAGFLRTLAAAGVVEHAARAVGRSAASAYALRNRREGRAFAKMWDAVLIHRVRARLAGDLQGRAIAGCVSVRKRDGVVVGEYHYYDNRLAMALLTRLDRLAEREAASEAQLRALSEDLDDYIDCVAEGGDADAFVDARKPVEPAPPPPDDDPELTRFALLTGCHHYRDFHPDEIQIGDLDPTRQAEWDPDQWVRFFRSGLAAWIEIGKKTRPGSTVGPGAPLFYHFVRLASVAADPNGDAPRPTAEEAAAIDTADLLLAQIRDWSEDQLARAWRSGFLLRVPDEFWDDLAEEEAQDGEEE